MKELILQKGEKIVCYVYENGKEIDKFTLKLNCNLQPIRDNQILTDKQQKVKEITEYINKNY